MNSTAKKTSINVLLNTWATMVYFASQWLLVVIITHISGYADAGIFSLAVSFSNIFSYISKAGVRGVQVADVCFQYSDNQYFTSRLISCAISILPFIFTLWWLDYSAELAACCVAMMCYKLFESLDDVLTGTFQRLYRYGVIAVSYTLKAAVTFIALLLPLVMKFPLHICILSMTLAYGTIIVFYDFHFLRDRHIFDWSAQKLRPLFTKCFPLMVSGILDAILLYLPRNSIEKMIGTEALGHYGTISIVVVILSTIGGAIWSSLLSKTSELISKKEWKRVVNFILKCGCIQIVFGIFTFVLGMLLGPFFFQLLYGKSILEHLYILPSVILSALFLLYNSFFSCIYIPMDLRNLYMASSGIAVLFCALFAGNFTSAGGIYGASICLTAALFVRFILLSCTLIVLLRRKLYEAVS